MARQTIVGSTTITVNNQTEADTLLNADGYSVQLGSTLIFDIRADVNYGGDIILQGTFRKEGAGSLNYTGPIMSRTTEAAPGINFGVITIGNGSIDSHMFQNFHEDDLTINGGALIVRDNEATGVVQRGSILSSSIKGGDIIIDNDSATNLIINSHGIGTFTTFHGDIIVRANCPSFTLTVHGSQRWIHRGTIIAENPNTDINIVLDQSNLLRFLGANNVIPYDISVGSNSQVEIAGGNLLVGEITGSSDSSAIEILGPTSTQPQGVLDFRYTSDTTFTRLFSGTGAIAFSGDRTITINRALPSSTNVFIRGADVVIGDSGTIRQISMSDGSISGTGNITRNLIATGGMVSGTFTTGLDLRLLEGSTLGLPFSPTSVDQISVGRNVIIDRANLNLQPAVGTYSNSFDGELFSAPNSNVPAGTFDSVTTENPTRLGTTRLKHIYRYSDGQVLLQGSDVGNNIFLDGTVHDGDTLPSGWVFDYSRSTTNTDYFGVRDTNAQGDNYDNNARKSFAIQAHPDNETSILIEWSGFGITLVPGHTYILVHDEGREAVFGDINTYTVMEANGDQNRIRDARISYQSI